MEELHKEESQRRQRQNLRESKVAIAGRNKYKCGSRASKHSTQHGVHANECEEIQGHSTAHIILPGTHPTRWANRQGVATFY